MQLVLLPVMLCYVLVAICAGSSLRALGSVAAVGSQEEACKFDHAPLDTLLKKHVTQPTLVDGIMSTLFDYEAVLKSSADFGVLDKYVQSLATFDPSCLTSNGKLAFWANTYNAVILHLVLSDARAAGSVLPASIHDLGRDGSDVWDRQAGVVNGKSMTLEHVLDEASKLGDPRIHAAVNCASLSCPDLKAGAYSASTLQQDLEAQFRAWVRNPSKGVRVSGSDAKVSSIFDWHRGDFPGSLESVLAKALDVAEGSIKVSGFLPYVWKLNSASAPPSSADKHAGADKNSSPIKI